MMHSHIKPVFFLSFSLCYDNLNKCSSLHVIKNCHWNLESIFVSSLGEPFPLFDRLKLGVQWDLKVGDTMRILTQVSIKSIFCVFFILSPCVFWQLMPILRLSPMPKNATETTWWIFCILKWDIWNVYTVIPDNVMASHWYNIMKYFNIASFIWSVLSGSQYEIHASKK